MKRNSRLALLTAGTLLLAGLSTGVCAEGVMDAGTLQVTVKDDAGSLVHSARVYIFSENQKQYLGTQLAQGSANFELPMGTYRIYAAMVLKEDGYIDHYSSPEAVVSVTPGEPTAVILSLQKAQDSEMILSDTARAKMGIDAELARYLN